MPTNIDLSPNQQHRFDGPIRSFEVQQGKVQLRGPDGRTSRPKSAGKTIPGGDIGGSYLIALEPSIVRVTSTDEAEVAEQAAERLAARDGKPEVRSAMKPPVL